MPTGEVQRGLKEADVRGSEAEGTPVTHPRGTFIPVTADPVTVGNLSETRWFPVTVGAAVGLFTGTAGVLLATRTSAAAPLLGAVFGGATAAGLSDGNLVQETLNAALADLLSSLVVFLVVVGAFLSTTGDVATAAVVTPFLLIWGSAVAIPIASVSLFLAVISGAVTSLAKRAVRD